MTHDVETNVARLWKKRSLTVSAVIGAAAFAALFQLQQGQAHHAFSAEFDGNRPVQLRGQITRVRWTNPHSWIYVDVPDESGEATNWAVEFGAPYALIQRGLRRTDFELGTEVIVDGYLAKNGQAVANASSVRLPDGRDFYTAAEDSPASRSE